VISGILSSIRCCVLVHSAFALGAAPWRVGITGQRLLGKRGAFG